MVTRAMQLKLKVVLVHEQDVEAGGCSFGDFFVQTPKELVEKHRLFDIMAVPLYRAPALRKISLRRVLDNMGAEPKSSARHQLLKQQSPVGEVSV